MPNGLYCHDTNNFDSHNTIEHIADYTILNTVARNKANYTTREFTGVDKAIFFNNKIGYLWPQRYIHLLQNNYFHNCPITVEDAKRAIHIYVHDTAYLQGKNKWWIISAIPILAHILLLHTIKDLQQDVTLCADLLFVQGTIFVHTISQKLIFRTIGEVKNKKYHDPRPSTYYSYVYIPGFPNYNHICRVRILICL